MLDTQFLAPYIARMMRMITIIVLCFLTASFIYLKLTATDDKQGAVPIGGEFNLTSHLGEAVNNDSFKGKPRLVYFGFTYCPDICPMGLAAMQAAVVELRGNAPEAMFITVDAERDTQEQLAVYMENFPNVMGLTGTPEQIKAAAKTYRIYYKKIENKDSLSKGYRYLLHINYRLQYNVWSSPQGIFHSQQDQG